ncbi:MAG TPA: LysR family transcriptional regulator [Spirillospora sp.]|nr:LysR family transcriptional regulator [Spirillospora sp.]
MDLKQLKAVVTVAEVGSVTRAAEILHLVQPALTRQIRMLEQELGVPLFERTRQGMHPTEAGTAVVARARRALHELERARVEVQPAPGVVAGAVTVGLLESTLDLLAEPFVAAVAREHPGVEVRLMTAFSGHLQQWLDDGDLDLALLYNLDRPPRLNTHPLVLEDLWAVAPPTEGLRGSRPVQMAQVAEHPLVLPADGHALRCLIDRAAAQADVKLHVAVQTNSLPVQKRLVAAGHGWTILPAVAVAEDIARGALSGAPLSDPRVRRSIVLAAQRAATTPPPVKAVAFILIHLIETAVAEGRWPSATQRSHPD